MALYMVTGTYAYQTPGTRFEGSGQYPGAAIEAPTAREAAETYRAGMIAARREAFRPIDATSVCAVALTGPPETFSDPIAAGMVPA